VCKDITRMCNASTDEEQELQGPCFPALDPSWVIINEMRLTVESIRQGFISLCPHDMISAPQARVRISRAVQSVMKFRLHTPISWAGAMWKRIFTLVIACMARGNEARWEPRDRQK